MIGASVVVGTVSAAAGAAVLKPASRRAGTTRVVLPVGAFICILMSGVAVDSAVHRRCVSLAISLAGIPAQRPGYVSEAQYGCGTVTDSHRLSHLFPAASSRLRGDLRTGASICAVRGYLSIYCYAGQALFLICLF